MRNRTRQHFSSSGLWHRITQLHLGEGPGRHYQGTFGAVRKSPVGVQGKHLCIPSYTDRGSIPSYKIVDAGLFFFKREV